MPSVDRLPYENRLDDLMVTYRQAQRTIVAQMQAAMAEGNLSRAATLQHQLSAVLDTLTQLGHETDPIARRIVADAVTESAAFTEERIGIELTGVQRSTFVGVQTEAIKSFEDQLFGRLADARATIGRRVADVYAEAGRHSTVLHLLGARGSAREASRDLVERLTARGVKSFVDRAGREWALESYADMAIRTTTRQAVVQGAVVRMSAQGIRLGRISRHASSCDTCLPWEGRLVSLDGTVSTYRGEAVTTFDAMPWGGPPFHGRCRHTIMPVADELDALRAELGL